jgi:hypothetical protein
VHKHRISIIVYQWLCSPFAYMEQMAPTAVCLTHVMQDKSKSARRSMVPDLALALRAVHSIVIYNPPAWVGLPAQLALDQLRDLDLQVIVVQL